MAKKVISPMTLQKLPSLQEVVGEMVQKYIDERGAGDLFDLKEAMSELSLAEIGLVFYNMVNDNNYAEMLKIGKCPECATDLISIFVPATRYEPSEDRVECPKCHNDYNPNTVG